MLLGGTVVPLNLFNPAIFSGSLRACSVHNSVYDETISSVMEYLIVTCGISKVLKKSATIFCNISSNEFAFKNIPHFLK